MSSLNRTFSLTKVDSTPFTIAEYLHFDVMAVRIKALYKNTSVLEEVFPTRLDRGKRLLDFSHILTS